MSYPIFVGRVPGMLFALTIAVGCSSAPSPKAGEQGSTAASGAATCPALPAPPTGKCRSNADCTGKWVECQWGSPKPGPRVTGSGALFGTDGAKCEFGYQTDVRCVSGMVARTRTAANLCPEPECVPICTPSSCAQGETCDQGSRLCRPTSCLNGWRCAKDQICKHGPNADAHGCAPRCPGYGTCVVYGPPQP